MRDTTPVMVTLKLPERLARRLDAGARRRGAPRSAFIRDAIEAALQKEDSAAGGKGTVLDNCRDLVGSVDGGPRDLSHEPRHMRGFGRSGRRL